jgi:hypothetical protein
VVAGVAELKVTETEGELEVAARAAVAAAATVESTAEMEA